MRSIVLREATTRVLQSGLTAIAVTGSESCADVSSKMTQPGWAPTITLIGMRFGPTWVVRICLYVGCVAGASRCFCLQIQASHGTHRHLQRGPA